MISESQLSITLCRLDRLGVRFTPHQKCKTCSQLPKTFLLWIWILHISNIYIYINYFESFEVHVQSCQFAIDAASCSNKWFLQFFTVTGPIVCNCNKTAYSAVHELYASSMYFVFYCRFVFWVYQYPSGLFYVQRGYNWSFNPNS